MLVKWRNILLYFSLLCLMNIFFSFLLFWSWKYNLISSQIFLKCLLDISCWINFAVKSNATGIRRLVFKELFSLVSTKAQLAFAPLGRTLPFTALIHTTPQCCSSLISLAAQQEHPESFSEGVIHNGSLATSLRWPLLSHGICA